MTAERPSTTMVSTLWERLLHWFILVSATARFEAPWAINLSTSSGHVTTSWKSKGCYECLEQNSSVLIPRAAFCTGVADGACSAVSTPLKCLVPALSVQRFEQGPFSKSCSSICCCSSFPTRSSAPPMTQA